MSQRDAIKSVVCPNCNAQPGQPCSQPTDYSRRPVRWFHFAREHAYRDNQRQNGERA